MVLYFMIALGLVLLVRTLLGRGYSPGHVWGYTWAFAWGCQALLGGGYLLDSNTVILVSSCNVAFILAAYIASAPKVNDSTKIGAAVQHQPFLDATRLRSTIGLILVAVGIVALDLGLKQLRHPGIVGVFGGSFTDFATSLRDTKSSLNVAAPLEFTVSTALMNCAAVLAGIQSALPRSRVGIGLIAGTIGLAFMQSAGTGVRSYLLMAILILISSHLATKLYMNGVAFRFRARALMTSGALVFAFLVWVVIVQSARRGDFSFAQVAATLDYLRAWFAGYIPALSQWTATFDLYGSPSDNPLPAENLLRGVLGPLGFVSGEGIDSVTAAVDIGSGAFSNAMTVFRPLLSDFGFAGSIVACAIAGLLSQTAYRRVSSGSVALLVPLIACYAAIIYSFNGWFFAYGSRLVGVALALVIVVTCHRLRGRAAKLSNASGRAPAHSGDGTDVEIETGHRL